MTTENAEHAGGSEPGGEHKREYKYTVDGKPYKSESNSITGAEIKAKIPGFNPTFQLFLEGHGGAPDRLIGDSETVELKHGHEDHFYTAPPATFGGRSSVGAQ